MWESSGLNGGDWKSGERTKIGKEAQKSSSLHSQGQGCLNKWEISRNSSAGTKMEVKRVRGQM